MEVDLVRQRVTSTFDSQVLQALPVANYPTFLTLAPLKVYKVLTSSASDRGSASPKQMRVQNVRRHIFRHSNQLRGIYYVSKNKNLSMKNVYKVCIVRLCTMEVYSQHSIN